MSIKTIIKVGLLVISQLFKVVLEWLMKNDYIIRDALLSIIFIKNVPSWTSASER